MYKIRWSTIDDLRYYNSYFRSTQTAITCKQQLMQNGSLMYRLYSNLSSTKVKFLLILLTALELFAMLVLHYRLQTHVNR